VAGNVIVCAAAAAPPAPTALLEIGRLRIISERGFYPPGEIDRGVPIARVFHMARPPRRPGVDAFAAPVRRATKAPSTAAIRNKHPFLFAFSRGTSWGRRRPTIGLRQVTIENS
jgi:hypothetical protein